MTPGFVLDRVGLILLGVPGLHVLGLVLLSIGTALYAAGMSSVKAVKLSMKLDAPDDPTRGHPCELRFKSVRVWSRGCEAGGERIPARRSSSNPFESRYPVLRTPGSAADLPVACPHPAACIPSARDRQTRRRFEFLRTPRDYLKPVLKERCERRRPATAQVRVHGSAGPCRDPFASRSRAWRRPCACAIRRCEG